VVYIDQLIGLWSERSFWHGEAR